MSVLNKYSKITQLHLNGQLMGKCTLYPYYVESMTSTLKIGCHKQCHAQNTSPQLSIKSMQFVTAGGTQQTIPVHVGVTDYRCASSSKNCSAQNKLLDSEDTWSQSNVKDYRQHSNTTKFNAKYTKFNAKYSKVKQLISCKGMKQRWSMQT